MKIFLALFLTTYCLLQLSPASAQIHEWEGPALPDVKIKVVNYKAWIPPGEEPLEGALFLIPGRHGDGRGMADDAAWQSVAGEVRFALIACQFADGDPGLYQNDEKGEVCKALDYALLQLSRLAERPELVDAPVAFWGTSAGSNLASRFCNLHPDRVAAFASSKGTWGPGYEMPRGKDDIPMFFAIGGNDKADWVETSIRNVELGVKKKAPWTLALHKTEGHSVGGSLDVARPFLRATILTRLGKNTAVKEASPFAGFTTTGGSSSASSSRLRKIDQKHGWLGDPDTLEVAPVGEFRGRKTKAVWLPDETTALAWKNYLGK